MADGSTIYQLFARAMVELKQIVCTYLGHRRELCPTILGHSLQGDEKALTYQFAGGSDSGLAPGGEWRCLSLSEVSDVELRDGPWHTGTSHKTRHSCVAIVDLDVNPDSPYEPKRSIAAERARVNTPTRKRSRRQPKR